MSCALVPFDRQRLLSCDGEFNADSNNHWVILLGGSNAYFEAKNLIDVLLNIPGGTNFDPVAMYDSTLVYSYEIGAIFDFVWDSSHDVVHKGFFPMQDHNYWILPNDAAELFLNVSVPPKGGFRLSFMATHDACDFQELIKRIVGTNSPWLQTNPVIDVKLEWSFDFGINNYETCNSEQKDFCCAWNPSTKEMIVGHISYLDSLKTNENINFRSLIFTDSAFDCALEPYSSASMIMEAIEETRGTTSIPVNFWSKRVMAGQHASFPGGACLTDWHAYSSLTHVFTARYFNQICQPPAERSSNANKDSKICLSADPNYCFHQPSYWNFNYACKIEYLDAVYLEMEGYCQSYPPPAVALPVCIATPVEGLIVVDKTVAFDAFVYLTFALSALYLFCECIEFRPETNTIKEFVRQLRRYQSKRSMSSRQLPIEISRFIRTMSSFHVTIVTTL